MRATRCCLLALPAIVALSCGNPELEAVSVAEGPTSDGGPPADRCSEFDDASDVAWAGDVLTYVVSWHRVESVSWSKEPPENLEGAWREVIEGADFEPIVVVNVSGATAVWGDAGIDAVLLTESSATHAQEALQAGDEVYIGSRPSVSLVATTRPDGSMRMGEVCGTPLTDQITDFALSNGVTPADAFATMASDPTGELMTQFREWYSGGPPVDWESIPVELRALHPALTPADVISRLDTRLWSLSIPDALVGAEDWVICPRTAPGWSPCISLAVDTNDGNAFAEFYFEPGDQAAVDFWLFRDPVDLALPVTLVASAVADVDPNTIVGVAVTGLFAEGSAAEVDADVTYTDVRGLD